jgi:hypothetical protein
MRINANHRLALKHVAEGGTLAEEVISTVRTAHAFGTQKTLSSIYDVHVTSAKTVEAKAAFVHGIGLGIFFFVIYAAYALGAQIPLFFYLVTEIVASFPIWYNLDQRGSW